MQRIVILGNSGSGKSTLARAIGERLGLPVVHLDRLFWSPGWVEPEAEVFRDQVRSALAQDAWVCEGNYARRTFDLRLPRADLIIWLDTPRWVCLKRVVLRSLSRRPRADLPAGCSERLNWEFVEFLKFVWGFDGAYRRGIEAMRVAIGPGVPVVHFRGRREIAGFLGEVDGAGGRGVISDGMQGRRSV
ncbi:MULTISPECIES: P-loop NTPase family protein [Pseudomonas]|uniref:AAA family ATPase n=1 Tax=Pseudomonas TaxID=286 RepID=UPI002B406D0A|nr:AAA family ATPase [Pseudomonas sichuanensis]